MVWIYLSLTQFHSTNLLYVCGDSLAESDGLNDEAEFAAAVSRGIIDTDRVPSWLVVYSQAPFELDSLLKVDCI